MENPHPVVKVHRRTGPAHVATHPSADDSSAPSLPQDGIFAGLSARSLKNLASYGKFEEFATGTEIIREGAPQDRLYVVVRGRLALRTRHGGREIEMKEAMAGECVGEACLLDPSPAPATIRALENCLLWSLDITGLRIFIGDHAGGAGAFLMGMATCLSARLREANLRICQNHMLPVETLPAGRERAITASNAPIQPGFFQRIKKTLPLPLPERKIRISTKIKM